ncbi:hypothetical protein [Chryseobacterium sp. RLHN22]|uniref:hypothetical protein n=1 Tax=Chryseobacterium sp. RLHN22 TaxID=3437885 RepID=UPI003D9BF530
MNEATLEARIDRVLQNVFPTFKEVEIEHQTSFTLKIGHHNIPFDSIYSDKNSVRGISDIILKIDGKNVIMLELKQENVHISDADIKQGLSYARLLEQMPPITLISNGRQNKFFNTYTANEIDTDTVDNKMIQDYINNSFRLAANDFKDAVNLLLNNDPIFFSHVINQISEEKFKRQIGCIEDLIKPICLDFNIERSVLLDIMESFEQGNNLIGIQGQAFSGKTTLLYQFFKKISSKENFVYYLDCNDQNYSIYRQLANTFSKNTRVTVTETQILEWMRSSLEIEGNKRFYLLLDNFNDNIPSGIMTEIVELIDIFDDGHHRILYTIDEFNYEQIAYVPYKNYKTIIGDKSKVIKLDELDDNEYISANELMYNEFHLLIENGGHYSPEYREPRTLRQMVSFYKDENLTEEKYEKISAVPNVELLRIVCSNRSYSREIHRLMEMMAQCFIDELDLRHQNSYLNIAASGSGSITVEIFRQKYPNYYDTLLKSSITLTRHFYDNGLSILYPKLPELLAFYCIPIISDMVAEKSKEIGTDETLNYFTQLAISLPLCDIVGAEVLLKLSSDEPQLFSDLVNKMLNIPPKKEIISGEMKALLFTEDVGHIKVDIEVDENEEAGSFIVDFFPYAVLSQLSAFPLGSHYSDIDENITKYNFHLILLYKIASNPNFVRRADSRSLRNMRPFESYEWERIGQIISTREGIIEPIVVSLQKCFRVIPDEMKLLCDYGFGEKNFNLLYRLYLAIHGLVNFGDPYIADLAQNYVRTFHRFFAEFMAAYLGKDINDSPENEDRYNSLKKLDIEEELHRLFFSKES